MFDPSPQPRVFGIAPGVDFPRSLVTGVLHRMQDKPPEALARVQIYVNTRRMQRRMRAIFDEGPARLLPRIRLLTEIGEETALGEIPAAVSPMRRRFELAQLVAKRLDLEPELAPRAALYELSDSLAALIEEMQREGVDPQAIHDLDVADKSGHWQRSLTFIQLVEAFVAANGDAPDKEGRQRQIIEALAETWRHTPPNDPIIVAGSTGSFGTTADFMRAVARLPQGAVILPGFDFDLPASIWQGMQDARTAEDHPQYRFRKFLDRLDTDQGIVRPWNANELAPQPERNKLVSLALRPAPVTDQWMIEGKRLSGIARAAQDMTLIEAPSPRAEANAIAIALREAVERGQTAALITPDRQLTRQVTAALDRWRITPDDSAGRPLPLTAPGRFLRHVAALFGEPLTVEALLTLLKHPLTHTGADRGPHLLNTRELELHLRRNGPPYPQPADLRKWASDSSESRAAWAEWLIRVLDGMDIFFSQPLSQAVERLILTAEMLARGPAPDGSGELWEKEAGKEALRWITEFRDHAPFGGDVNAVEFRSLLKGVLQNGEAREAVGTHPGVMIWGTLEARVQGAELVIMGGLNEGVWPGAPKPDPWLNREMRHQAGLLLPERQIGLAGHDFQQAIGAKQVILSRAIRDAEAQTVPSRWLNRLTNLMNGLNDESATALADMRKRGARYLALAERLDAPAATLPPAPRPSPRPPVDARPRRLSITEVQRLIRDPYAIYAKHVLGLRKLDPLRQTPDAPLRGTVLHRILELFVKETELTDLDAGRIALMQMTDRVLEENAPWPAARAVWRAKMQGIAEWFVTRELDRQSRGMVDGLEARAKMYFPMIETELHGKLDRVDRLSDGQLVVYDYKTGQLPSKKIKEFFDKQLALAAAMLEHGHVEDIAAAPVAETVHIRVNSDPKEASAAWDAGQTAEVLKEFQALIAAYRDRSQGYTSRRALQTLDQEGDYDHLARFGEWDISQTATGEDVGE